MAIELSVTIKNSESRYTQKFLIYEKVTFEIDDPIILQCLNEAKNNFGREQEIDDIVIKAKLTL